MILRNLVFVGGLLMALAVPSAANAYQSVTTGAVNVRAGAGVNSARIGTLGAGTSLWVDRCVRSWCLVKARGLRGWVSARYLAGTGIVRRAYPPSIYGQPFVGLGWGYTTYRFDFSDNHHHKKKKKAGKKKAGKKSADYDGERRYRGDRKKRKGDCPPWICVQ
jgi:uncharacterized protein YraI